jgi:hypothetical protein
MIPGDDLGERSAVAGRIPFHQNQLGGKLVPLALLKEAVNEDLRPIQSIAAVVIVATRRDQCEVRGFVHGTPMLCYARALRNKKKQTLVIPV